MFNDYLHLIGRQGGRVGTWGYEIQGNGERIGKQR